MVDGVFSATDVSLVDTIETRSATVCVVGLGYVGLTVACALAQAGFSVTGIDVDARKVAQVNDGQYPLNPTEPDLPEVVSAMVGTGRLSATADFQACAEADVVLVVVQTPVDERTHQPALDALHSAVSSIGAVVRPGTLIVVESTIPPGTMRDDVVPLLERASGLCAARDLYVACCPERVMPGRLLANLSACSRVVGGWTPAAGEVAATLYRTIVRGDLDVTDCLTAELVKTAENAYRDVQIAFANELAMLCEGYGANVYTLRALVNKSPHRDVHLPGAGVGGHCIPKDPWLLVARAGPTTPVRLIPAARAINDSMPLHVGALTEAALAQHGRPLAQARVVVLGYAYLENSDDARNSPSADLVAWLHARGATVAIHDPFVPGYDLDITEASVGADCLILMVAHSLYRTLSLEQLGRRMRTRVLVDGRNVFDPAAAEAAAFTYRCVGVGVGGCD